MDRYTRPHWGRAALLTIDVQQDFTLPGATAEIEGTMEKVPEMQRLVRGFRASDTPVIHAVRLYREDGSNVDLCRKQLIEDGAEVVRPGTEGAALVDDIEPDPRVSLDADQLLDGDFQEIGEDEWVMYKPRWSAFHRTDLDRFLVENDVDTLVVCGCNFPNCPRTTLYDASQHDYRLVFAPDATSGTYERGIEELGGIGVSVEDTESILHKLA